MNFQTIKTTVLRSYGRGGLILKKYSPEILLGVGLIGGVVAAVLAAKATLKTNDIIDEHIEKMNWVKSQEAAFEEDSIDITKEELIKERVTVYTQTGLQFAKLYGPSIGIGVLSITAILGAHGIMAKRQVALISAYGILSEGFKSYRERVIEKLGADTDKMYSLGLREGEQIVIEEDENGKKTKTKKKGLVYDYSFKSIYSRFFDESNPQFSTDRLMNKAFLTARQNYMNDVLTIRGHVFLNEVYESLGFQHTKEGAIVGWVLRSNDQMKAEGRDGFIDFGISDYVNDDTREVIRLTKPNAFLLDFNVDGIVYDLI
jgi:hypothetical protein